MSLNYEVVKNMSAVLGPTIFAGWRIQKQFTAVCYRRLPATVWQSLVEFCGLKCVGEAKPGNEENAALLNVAYKIRSCFSR